MTKSGRLVTVVLAGVLGMLVSGRANAQTGPATATGSEATVVLHVVNYANVPDDVLSQAMARVGRIYENIGVRMVWIAGNAAPRKRENDQLHLTVQLLSREMVERLTKASGVGNHVLGRAHADSGRASIFCDRIAGMPGAPKLLAIPLGTVIAHEVGHLLLPATGHSRGGLMSAGMEMHSTSLQSFNAMEARTIRTTLVK